MHALPLRTFHVFVSSTAHAQRAQVPAEVFARIEQELQRRALAFGPTEEGEGFVSAGDHVGLYVVSRRERQVTLLEVTRRLPLGRAG